MITVIVLIGLGLLVLAVRAGLIVLGIYKEPVLRRFETYGEESPYSPALGLLCWSIIFTAYLMVSLLNVGAVLFLLIFLLAPFSVVYNHSQAIVRQYPSLFTFYPRWYSDLVDRTSRDERRRLAYLWLRLPLRTRLLYNARDEFFNQWADLVLMTIA